MSRITSALRSWTQYSAERRPTAWLFLLPALVFILLFNVVPLVRIFIMAFQSNSLTRPKFVAFDNFTFVAQDPEFHQAVLNTAIFAIVVVPVSLILSLLAAIIVNGQVKGKRFFEVLFFVPYLTSIIAIGIVFRYLLNGDYGVVNFLLTKIGIGPFDFLNDPDLNIPALLIFGVWAALAFNIIILLSGLRAINPDYYKVAEMFGASSWEKFRKITLPQLVPTLSFLTIVDFIGAFKIYSEVYALFNGSPGVGKSATTAVFYVYDKFYSQSKYGQGMAAAVLLFIIILLFTLLQNFVVKRLAR